MATSSSILRAGNTALAAVLASVAYSLTQSPAQAERSLKSFLFPSLSTPKPAAPPSPSPNPLPPAQADRDQNDNPRTTEAGFDPESLERGARALREINNSVHSKQVFELMRKQEDTRQAENAARAAALQVFQAQREIERQRAVYEEQGKLIQQQAQTKAQMARYEDELARKRMQSEREAQKTRDAELVKMQEESAVRQEQIRRRTEEHIQGQHRRTERERAEIERETLRVKSMAEAEGRAHEAKLAEDVNRRMLTEQANREKDKWLAAINTTFGHIGGGLKSLLMDKNKLVVAVGGVTALAAGVYTAREGARVMWGYVDRILGQPSLIRESSKSKYPWSRWIRHRGLSSLTSGGNPTAGTQQMSQKGFGDVILHPTLHKRITHLAVATSNTKLHEAPFRNMLFYGPPGTGKTMAAKQLAQQSGLDYALMTGGDVAPLGAQAVTKIHELFDWAGKSRQGLLLFIDEADAFLCKRNSTHMSEAQRSALNALLYRTGDQSRDIVLVLATNRPSDLDAAIADRIDEVLEFPLPGKEERVKLLNLYLDKYIAQAGSGKKEWKFFVQDQQKKIEIKGITDDIVCEAASKTVGFSGREIAKLMASVQGAVYGSKDCVLDADLFLEVVNYKVAEHHQRKKMTAATSPASK